VERPRLRYRDDTEVVKCLYARKPIGGDGGGFLTILRRQLLLRRWCIEADGVAVCLSMAGNDEYRLAKHRYGPASAVWPICDEPGTYNVCTMSLVLAPRCC